jgi:ABC-type multidrug transport system ATPase subunit
MLVLEKEERVKELLQVNGLIEVDYWIGFLTWNFLMLSLSTIIFLYIGWNYIAIDFFQKANPYLIFWLLSAWNFGQIGFSLFVSSFITKSTTGTLVGYSLSIFLVLWLTINSQFLFPNPVQMPWFFYLIP